MSIYKNKHTRGSGGGGVSANNRPSVYNDDGDDNDDQRRSVVVENPLNQRQRQRNFLSKFLSLIFN